MVYWGTPRVKATVEPTAWPQVYRERSERQENSFKRMIDHGALNTNYGRKKIIGADRHQQRVREQLDQALETAQKRVDKQGKEVKTQQAKVVESASKGHGKRLEQRQRTLAVLEKAHKDAQHKHSQLAAQAAAVGPPGERADRDFRKQTIMTVRTLLLENALMSFMAGLLVFLKTKVSLDCLLNSSLSGAGRGWRRLPRSCIGSTPLAYRCRITACWRRSFTDCVRWTCGIRETDTRSLKNNASLIILDSWADQMSIFGKAVRSPSK